MSRPLLSIGVLLKVHQAAIEAGLAHSRDALLTGIHSGFVMSIPVAPTPSGQLLSDLHTLNDVDRLADGSVPLALWLANAASLAGPRSQSEVFRRAREAATAGSGHVSREPASFETAPRPTDSLHDVKDSDWRHAAVRCFLAFDAADARFAHELEKHLAPLIRQNSISIWGMHRIHAGADVRQEIDTHLRSAQMVLLLVSADFLASESLNADIVEPALRQRSTGMKVIPILVRPCSFWHSPLGNLQPLPASGEPISSARSTEAAFAEVARSLREIIYLRAGIPVESASAAGEPSAMGGGRTRGDVVAGRSLHNLGPPKPPRRIHEIFRPFGEPEATYVEPQEFRALAGALSMMGRGLVVEGPSGIGKTTAVRKALARTEGVRWLHVLKPKDGEALDRIVGEATLTGHLVIDDFHRLTDSRKSAVADFIKLTADEPRPNAKVTVIGLTDARQPLFRGDSNLTGRVTVVRFGRQPSEKILELITKGEEEANIRFKNRDELLIAARGSFIIAQQLCLEAALRAGIEETQPVTINVDVPSSAVVEEVMGSLRAAFEHAVLDFIASDINDSPRGVCFALLWVLSKSEGGSVGVGEVGYHVEELQDAVNRLDRSELQRRVEASGLQRYLFCNAGSLSVEDPQFAFYLQHLQRVGGWKDLAERANLVVSLEGQLRLAVRRVEEATSEPAHFLDIRPFPWWHKDADQLFHILLEAYVKPADAKALAQRAGVSLHDWDPSGGALKSWHSLLETTSQQNKIRALVSAALDDANIKDYHGALKALLIARE
jgi:hypothetical protein